MRINHMKKATMAQETERRVANSGWVPEPLRRPRHSPSSSAPSLPEFLECQEPVAA